MNSESSGSYYAIVDKGTLDAIASSASTSTSTSTSPSTELISSAADDAAAYVSEMWRILIPSGLFAVITTMPPKIFRSIAIDPIGGAAVSNWSTCAKKKIRTNEGGVVYLYMVRKTAPSQWIRPTAIFTETTAERGKGNGYNHEITSSQLKSFHRIMSLQFAAF
jgi:hypothetical protein